MNNKNQPKLQFDPQAAAIAKSLAYTENGGSPNFKNPSAGKTGESKSVFQFEPGTWKAYAKQISGNENLPLNAENESLVTYAKVKDWYDQDSKEGYPPDVIAKRIASRWNAGSGEPDAYMGKFSDGTSSQGVNKKYGVKYDVPGYAKKVADYARKFSGQTQKSTVGTTANTNVGLIPPPATKPTSNKGKKGLLDTRLPVGSMFSPQGGQEES